MESVSTGVGSQGGRMRGMVLYAAGVGREEDVEEERSRWGAGQVSCQSHGAAIDNWIACDSTAVWIACWMLAASILLPGLFG